MKNTVIFTFLFVLVCGGLFAQNVSLDQAVQSSAKTIESRLSQGEKVAVLVFTSPAQAFSDYIIDELATALSVGNKIQVIDRQHTDAIRKELNIQMSGEVSDREVRRVGQQLGAQYVVTGSLVDIGNAYRFRVAAIAVSIRAVHSQCVPSGLFNTERGTVSRGQRAGWVIPQGIS